MSRSPSPQQTPSSPPASFEESIRSLAEIVDKLEKGDLPLEQSLTLFEDGVRLARASQAQLDRAEKRVEELLAVAEDGSPVTRELSSGS